MDARPAPGPPGVLARIESQLSLRKYQREALRAWAARDCRGIVHMATGTGKTLIGISAILWAREGGHRCLVVVPTRALIGQWASELKGRGGLTADEVRIACGSARLRRKSDALVLLTTIQTARRNADALARMAREDDRQLVVVDECHRTGAPRFSKALAEAMPYRLGLSATPDRPYDPTGTRKVMSYFNGVAHEYDLGTAVSDGYLAPYEYHVHSTYLNLDEAKVHEDLCIRVTTLFDWIKERYPDTEGIDKLGDLLAYLRSRPDELEATEAADELQSLLFRRARVVKNAAGKVEVFRKLCDSLAGKKAIVFTEEIEFAEKLAAAAKDAGLEPMLYHSLQRNSKRDATLADFRKAESAVLIAVRALDEGLDVPDADVAVLAASSTSVLQHIQRRGRVLRPMMARNKVAELHDFYVIGVDRADRIKRIREDSARVQYHGFDDLVDDQLVDDATTLPGPPVEVQIAVEDWDAGVER